MLDENLPTFYIKQSTESSLSSTIFLSHDGSELTPEYILRRPDPKTPAAQNCYGLALFDSYNPEVLFAEVQVQPEWTQPTLSQAEIRAQNGIPPPPVPIVPNAFTIQLYNPDQQVNIRQTPGSWNSSAYWEFDMPTTTFRQPSASALDRSQSDPGVSDITPKVAFKWKKDGKLSKDLSCFLVGERGEGRRKGEPDIPVAMFKAGKNLTLYQPNMHRVEVEDTKGLEEVFLLSAAVIRDVFFNPSREMFNISSPTTNAGRRKNSGPVIPNGKSSASPPLMSGGTFPLPASNRRHTSSNPQPPSVNARTQWEIDAETARLKALVEAEGRAREQAEREEQRRIKLMLEAEEKERARREKEIAKETERLRKQYGRPDPPSLPPRPQAQQGQTWHAPYNPNTPYNNAPPVYNTPERPMSTPVTRPQSGFLGNLFHSSSSSQTQPQPQAQSQGIHYPAQQQLHQQQQQQHQQHQQYSQAQNAPYLQAPASNGNGASSSGFFSNFGRRDVRN